MTELEAERDEIQERVNAISAILKKSSLGIERTFLHLERKDLRSRLIGLDAKIEESVGEEE